MADTRNRRRKGPAHPAMGRTGRDVRRTVGQTPAEKSVGSRALLLVMCVASEANLDLAAKRIGDLEREGGHVSIALL